eukprot:scaffold4840_cov115-Isochrysis_galbana.AAC.8
MEMENRGCDSASDSECFVKPAHPMPMRPPSLYISSFTLVHSAYHSMFRVRSCATLTAPARPHVRHMCMCARLAPWHHGQAGRQTGKGEREREIGRVEPVWNQYVYVVDKPPSAARAPALSPPPAPLPPTATAGCGDTASALPSCGVSAAHPARARCPNTIESIVVVIGGRSGVGGLLLVGEAGPHSLAPADGDGTAPTAAGGGRTASWTARTAADGPATPVSPAPAAGSAARRRIARCSLACLCPSLSCFVSIAHERSDREQPGAFPRSKGNLVPLSGARFHLLRVTRPAEPGEELQAQAQDEQPDQAPRGDKCRQGRPRRLGVRQGVGRRHGHKLSAGRVGDGDRDRVVAQLDGTVGGAVQSGCHGRRSAREVHVTVRGAVAELKVQIVQGRGIEVEEARLDPKLDAPRGVVAVGVAQVQRRQAGQLEHLRAQRPLWIPLRSIRRACHPQARLGRGRLAAVGSDSLEGEAVGRGGAGHAGCTAGLDTRVCGAVEVVGPRTVDEQTRITSHTVARSQGQEAAILRRTARARERSRQRHDGGDAGAAAWGRRALEELPLRGGRQDAQGQQRLQNKTRIRGAAECGRLANRRAGHAERKYGSRVLAKPGSERVGSQAVEHANVHARAGVVGRAGCGGVARAELKGIVGQHPLATPLGIGDCAAPLPVLVHQPPLAGGQRVARLERCWAGTPRGGAAGAFPPSEPASRGQGAHDRAAEGGVRIGGGELEPARRTRRHLHQHGLRGGRVVACGDGQPDRGGGGGLPGRVHHAVFKRRHAVAGHVARGHLLCPNRLRVSRRTSHRVVGGGQVDPSSRRQRGDLGHEGHGRSRRVLLVERVGSGEEDEGRRVLRHGDGALGGHGRRVVQPSLKARTDLSIAQRSAVQRDQKQLARPACTWTGRSQQQPPVGPPGSKLWGDWDGAGGVRRDQEKPRQPFAVSNQNQLLRRSRGSVCEEGAARARRVHLRQRTGGRAVGRQGLPGPGKHPGERFGALPGARGAGRGRGGVRAAPAPYASAPEILAERANTASRKPIPASSSVGVLDLNRLYGLAPFQRRRMWYPCTRALASGGG